MTVTNLTTPKRPSIRRSVSAVESRRHTDIDQEIRKYEDAVRDLKTKRNALAIIARVPPEILSKIFMFCAAACASEFNTLAWIKVAHVSRHFRAVALGCPSLWSSPVFTSWNWANEMLKRSKMAPLTIKADLSLMTPKMIEAVQNALRHISRTTHLHFTASNGTMDKLLGNLEQPAPFLQSLSISNSYPNYHYTSERYAFPQTFLKGDAPRLRDLELVRCSIPWDSPLFHNLSHLKICDTGSQFRPTINQMVDMLEKMPSLESLNLTDCLPTLSLDSTATLAPLRVIQLPLLSRLQLSAQTLDCAHLLDHISFPATATVNLVCRGTDATDNDFSSLIPALTNWLKNNFTSTQPPLRRLLVNHVNTNSLLFQMWNNGGTDTKVPVSTPVLEMELSWRQFQASSFESVISTICRALPLSQLRVLHMMHLTETLASDSWVSIFGALPKVRIVDFRGYSGQQLVKALSTEIDSNNDQQSLMIFPGLRSLVFNDVAFEVDEKLKSMVEELQDCLMLRAEHNAGIHELTLMRCYHLCEQDVDTLREVVSEVIWDGLEVGFDEDVDSDESDHGLLSLDPYFSTYFDSDDDSF